MKHRIIKTLLLVCSISSLAGLTACSNGGNSFSHSGELATTNDKYGTFYQIFPYSYADSNGDGIGDLKGITAKLDYISSLNYDGIWLTPVHQSPTYHKYDVKDYKSIDSTFGTLSDYDDMVTASHKKGMKVLLDLVYNHTSSTNTWFETCLYDHLRNKTSDKYYNYYNVKPLETSVPSGWSNASKYGYSGLMYECQFWEGMPDLNLQNVLDYPAGALASDLKDIMSFWLVDHKVDGFRLDACTSYFTSNEDKNGLFLKWIEDTAKSLKSDVYIVGEGSWSNSQENYRYQKASGVDSFFNFEDKGASGIIAQGVNKSDATMLAYTVKTNLKSVTSTGIPAPFVANHDTGRMTGSTISIDGSSTNLKFMHLFLQMLTGCTFVYYGDEAGMKVVYKGSASTIPDEEKRQPMPWGDSYTCKSVAGTSTVTDGSRTPFGTVADQLNKSDSLVNFVKEVNYVRRAHPLIARGTAEQVYSSSIDDSFALVKKTVGDDSLYIAMNAGSSSCEEKIGDTLPEGYKLTDGLACGGGSFSYSSGTLKAPAKSVAIFEK